MELSHAVRDARQAQTRDGHAEWVTTDARELVTGEATNVCPLLEQARQRMHFVSRDHRRVSGEHHVTPHSLPSCKKLQTVTHLFANQFQSGERRVPLVEVVDVDVVAQRTQQPHPADPQQHFLGNAVIVVASVQTSREPAVGFIDRLEQVKRCRAEELALERSDGDRLATDLERELDPRWLESLAGRHAIGVHHTPIFAEALDRVALIPEDPDAHDGQLGITRSLHRVTR
ncbi:MAG: hypothetical protein R3B07_37355 [Polyangiaceae bacterium]